MNELPLIVYVVAFLVGSIPVVCCIGMQDYIDWKMERERKQKKLKRRLGDKK